MWLHLKPCPALTVSLLTRILQISLPINECPNKLAPKVIRNPSLYSFISYLVGSLTPFLNEPEISRDF